MQEQGMAKRLREECLKNYAQRVTDPVYNQALNTLSFLQKAFTSRLGERKAVVPLHLVQSICTLSIIGFDHAGGFQEYKKGVPSALDKIWLLFTTTLIHFVRDQEEANDDTLFFGCFEIPQWFVDESHSLEIFKYFE